jgi:hypothetical protein
MHHQGPIGPEYASILPAMFEDAKKKWPALTKAQFVEVGQAVMSRYLASMTEEVTVEEMGEALASELAARYGEPKNA